MSLVLIVVLLVLCRWRHRLRNGGMKHVSSMVSISAIPSDYVDDQDRPSGHLMTSIDWSPKMIDPHFEVNWSRTANTHGVKSSAPEVCWYSTVTDTSLFCHGFHCIMIFSVVVYVARQPFMCSRSPFGSNIVLLNFTIIYRQTLHQYSTHVILFDIRELKLT